MEDARRAIDDPDSLFRQMTISTGRTRYEEVRDELRASPRVWLITGAAGFIGSNIVQELLGLGQERIRYFVHVNETGSKTPWPPGYCGFDAWHKVRAVRLQLLAAVEERSRAQPAA